MHSSKVNDRLALFNDRAEAGRALAAKLESVFRRREREKLVVLAVPRGGVPIAFEIARAFGASFDVLLVERLVPPGGQDYTLGAVSETGVSYVNFARFDELSLAEGELAHIKSQAAREIKRKTLEYRGERLPLPIAGRTVVVVDEMARSGATAIAAARALRKRGAARVLFAAVATTPESTRAISSEVDQLVSLHTIEGLESTERLFVSTVEPTDVDVRAYLEEARHFAIPVGRRIRASAPAEHEEVRLEGSQIQALADIVMPVEPEGLVIFAHGMRSNRLSPRNLHVARVLHGVRVGTIIFDLFSELELLGQLGTPDLQELTRRVIEVAKWARERYRLPIAFFGAGTGAAAALLAAAALGREVEAVVTRGARPELGASELVGMTAPALLVVGGEDSATIEINRRVEAALSSEVDLEIIPGAGHLFEEAGALEAVAHLAADWYLSCFRHSSVHALREVSLSAAIPREATRMETP